MRQHTQGEAQAGHKMGGSAKASHNLCRLWKIIVIRKIEQSVQARCSLAWTLCSMGEKKGGSKTSARLRSFIRYILYDCQKAQV